MASGAVTPDAIPTTVSLSHPVAVPVAGERWRRLAVWLMWGGFGLILALAALAPLARTGDAHQYYAMAGALAELRPPALTADEVAAFKAWLQAQPAASGFPSAVRAVDQPPLVVAGRQEFSHFWFYPLLAAPVLRVTGELDLHPGAAFLVVNAGLLALALWQVERAYGAVVGLLVLASPLVWFINKAQVEVFTFALLGVAMAQAGRGRWLGAGLAAAIASTQNAPILGAVACFWGAGLMQQTWRRVVGPRSPNLGGTGMRSPSALRVTPRGIALVALTVTIGALHPAYYLWRLGVSTPQRLNGGIELGLPSPERYLAVLLDPDIGLLPWLPLTGLVAMLGLGLVVHPRFRPEAAGATHRPRPVGGLLAAPVERSSTPVVTNTIAGFGNEAVVLRTTGAASSPPTPVGGGNPRTEMHGKAALTTTSGGQSWPLAALCGLVIGVWFLFVFAQTTNVNSGGTVHISRYALWLLPLTLPLLATAAARLHPRLPALLPVAGALALLGYLTLFQPAQPERYVTPSPQAAFVTTWLPELYRTVPEIFYERQAHADGGVRGTAASADCRVILLHVTERALPCALSAPETAAAADLFAHGWEAAWIIRPGPLGLGDGRITGALNRP